MTKKGPGWLVPYVQQDHNGEPVYPIDKLRVEFDVRELPGGWIVFQHESKYGNWKYFAVLRFAQSETNGENELDSIVFYGDGPGGKPEESLRECRHTYWGEDGYIFYPDGKLIVAALTALSEFYDDLA